MADLDETWPADQQLLYLNLTEKLNDALVGAVYGPEAKTKAIEAVKSAIAQTADDVGGIQMRIDDRDTRKITVLVPRILMSPFEE